MALKIDISALESTSKVHSVSRKSNLRTTKLQHDGLMEKKRFTGDVVFVLIAGERFVAAFAGCLLFPQSVVGVGGLGSFPGCCKKCDGQVVLGSVVGADSCFRHANCH